ncbi:MAG: beta-galactosidase protein [Tardiphaga sp.]|nr:beta-galactosidase protein [Tardiphaga sp.]
MDFLVVEIRAGDGHVHPHGRAQQRLFDPGDVAPESLRLAEGEAAITLRRFGRGQIVYLGTYLTPDLIDALFAGPLAVAGVEPLLPACPTGVELTLREAEGRRLLFAINCLADAVTVAGVPHGTELLESRSVTNGTITLGPYGCAVVKLE